MEEGQGVTTEASVQQEYSEPQQQQYQAPTEAEIAAAEEQRMEELRRNYELLYPSGYADQYPHLKDNEHVEHMRNLATAAVQRGYLDSRGAQAMLLATAHRYDKRFHESKAEADAARTKQYNIDMSLLNDETAESDITPDRIKYVVHKKLEQHTNRHRANWMSKALDDPKVSALLHYLGVAKPQDNTYEMDLYSPDLQEKDIVAAMRTIVDNIKQGKRNPSDNERLLELSKALDRKRGIKR